MDEIIIDTAAPFIPYIFPNVIMEKIWMNKYIPAPTITTLLFVLPRYLETYDCAIADGTIEILIIWITTIDSTNSGKIIGTKIGDNMIPSMAKIIDMLTMINLRIFVEIPLASCDKAYEKSIPGIKYNNDMNCNPSW